jgi:CubicO group peptidase (beta-lactamase class C family)
MAHDHGITQALQKHVDAGSLAGVVTGVWRKGTLVHSAAVGIADLETQAPMQLDMVFRVASMTKPITAVAALLLMEEGRFALEDPITRWAPEFSSMRVLRSPTGPLDETQPAQRPITFEDLFTHRAGFTYGPFHAGPIAKALEDALGGDIDSHVTPENWIKALASLPLVQQPGVALHYGHATDLLGLLLARMEDAPLGEVLQRRVFGPLGMVDTGFTVPSSKRGRRAGLVGFNSSGALLALKKGPGGSTVEERPEGMTFVSGGQGLWSTLADYGRFAQLFAGGNTLLRPETLALMTTNRLTPAQRARSDVGGARLFEKGHGFGLGVAVVTEPDKAMAALCGGGVGSVGWPGGFGSWWQADPNNQTVMVLLCHNLVEREQFDQGIGFAVYEAIAQFQTRASLLTT